jgi:hypothetical protein
MNPTIAFFSSGPKAFFLLHPKKMVDQRELGFSSSNSFILLSPPRIALASLVKGGGADAQLPAKLMDVAATFLFLDDLHHLGFGRACFFHTI